MKVSVIVAAYNAEKYVTETMESLANQSIDDYEIIVVNDGSKDHTIDILRDYESRYDNITVVDKENGGPSSARNCGLDLAKGEYVYFFDADDVLELDALEALYERAKEKKADLVIAKYDIFNRFQTFAVNGINDLVQMEKIDKYEQLVSTIHALPIILDYKEHDYITGTISHLPHIISAGLVNLVHDSDSAEGVMKMIAAGGFKDITRISSSSPVMWQNICASNREPLLSLMDQYLALLTQLRGYIDSSNEQALLSFFQQAKDYRDSITLPSVKSPTVYYECFVDLVDETGGIAAVAGLLAQYHISIKNIGIVNNREFEEGVLQLAFPDKQTLTRAKRLLTDNGYMVHER